MGRNSPCAFLEWDSTFFGLRIARVVDHQLHPDDVRWIDGWCREEDIDCLYFLSDGDEKSVRVAESSDFHLVDIRVTLERATETIPDASDSNPTVTIRPSTPLDIPSLRAIARVNHRDSRFYADTQFPRAHADALFETWIDKSCLGFADAVLVAEVGSRAVGYVSCQCKEDERGQIGLLGVAPESQGNRLGKLLVYQALLLLREKGCASVSVVTQGRNVRAQRLYQRCGFVTSTLQLWYHRWFAGADAHGVSK